MRPPDLVCPDFPSPPEPHVQHWARASLKSLLFVPHCLQQHGAQSSPNIAPLWPAIFAVTWGPSGSKAAGGTRLQTYTAAKLPPLQTVEAFPSLGLRLAVHQRVGTDHLRTGKPIEDVVLHACPCGPFGAASALFCVFDGHSGIQAAEKARAIVPGMLASKLQVGWVACPWVACGPPLFRWRIIVLLGSCYVQFPDSLYILDCMCVCVPPHYSLLDPCLYFSPT